MTDLQTLSLLLAVGLSALLSYNILHSRRAPAAVVAWLAVVNLIPYLGALLWILIGARKLRRERWLWDRAAGRWQHCQPSTALPAGSIVRLNAEEGGYDATLGWMPHARLTVVPALTVD